MRFWVKTKHHTNDEHDQTEERAQHDDYTHFPRPNACAVPLTDRILENGWSVLGPLPHKRLVHRIRLFVT
jgi:hypothetical protein